MALSRPKAASALAAIAFLLPQAAAMSRQPSPVVESRRITAFDVLVGLTRSGEPDRSVAPPADLRVDDLSLLWDGQPLPLVGLASGGEDSEPWRLVVYIDRTLSSSHTIRWATMELAERAHKLTEMGEVEIVVAEPEPRRLLAPSRDARLIDESLSGIFLSPAGIAEPVARREAFLVEHPRSATTAPPERIARRAAGSERLLVRRQMDRLLRWAVESEPPTSRRALLLVCDGWDLDIGAFYSDHLTTPAVELGGETRELAEALAAHGWIVAPLAPPAPPAGPGRFGAFILPDVTFPWLFAVKLRSLEAWLDGNRKPKRADALVELGDSLRRQGLLDRAIDSYRQAVYHYYDHPKTAGRQATALVALGETLELRGETDAARDAFRAAVVFDPALAPRFPFAAARLLQPRQPLKQLATVTTGRLAADSPALERMLTSLTHRLRLTAQLAGAPDGALHRLAVRLRRPGFEVEVAPVARWGTPASLVQLRLRDLLENGLTAGALDLAAARLHRPRRRGEPLGVELQLAPGWLPPGDPDGSADLLVSWASVGADGAVHYGVRTLRMPVEADGAAHARLALDVPADQIWLALLAEAPEVGLWGGCGVELPRR